MREKSLSLSLYNVVRPGSGPSLAVLKVRFRPKLSVRLWPKVIFSCSGSGFSCLALLIVSSQFSKIAFLMKDA